MTISIKSPTSTTGSIQLNGNDVLTIDSSGNLTAPNNLTVTGNVATSGTIPAANLTGALPAIDGSALTGITTGKILQVVSTTKTDTWSTGSGAFVDVTGMSVTITPAATSSKILIIGTLNFSKDGGNNDVIIRLLRGSTHIAYNSGTTNTSHSSFSSGDGAYYGLHNKGIQYLDSPSTTSATTYKINIKNVAGATYLNRRGYNADYGSVSTITAFEVGA